MLELKNIKKVYASKDVEVQALKGINIAFRESEFVSILGPSGCGKTTTLNIIGGLDHYTEGDLIINGKSTKEYKDHDWDVYRNNTIGFVFQSYNLIPHQTVLGNVELSLTLSGVSKQERKQRAIDALIKVGLKDQIYKKPNQLSGGQMQRVAIARAIVNNPKIILADEPTGALDTQTSVQVMEILKEISKNCLVVMVTHNPELAEQYSSRIIKLLDGELLSDSNPLSEQEIQENYKALAEKVESQPTKKKQKQKKVKMGFGTGFALSLKNLMTKKGRTFLTAFAGSIGIIGIALVLSISSGFSNYISKVEEDTLSSYPLSVDQVSTDLSAFTAIQKEVSNTDNREEGYIYSNNVLETIMTSAMGSVSTNNLKDFKNYLETNHEQLDEHVTDIKYVYNVDLNIYQNDYATAEKPTQLNPYKVSQDMSPVMKMYFSAVETMIDNLQVWQEMISNEDFMKSQYDLKAGKWPTAYNEVILSIDDKNGINDYFLYALGIKPASELEQKIQDKMNGIETPKTEGKYTYDDFLGRTYRVLPTSDYYVEEDTVNHVWKNVKSDKTKVKDILVNKGIDIKIVGIVAPAKGSVAGSISGAVGYSKALTEYLIDYAETSDVVVAQRAESNRDILSDSTDPINDALLKSNLTKMGVVDKDNPRSIQIFPISFEGKEKIIDFIDHYNETRESKDDQIKYSDLVGVLMGSIKTIIDAISYVLIAFVSISLIVSSIMIAIVTHISVMERTKEIGVLRSIGASKRDVSNVFNAETLMIGFAAGVLGILVTIVLDIPINLVLAKLANMHHLAKLPVVGAIALILVSTLLTIIAGLIPASKAAKLDPVEALRSE